MTHSSHSRTLAFVLVMLLSSAVTLYAQIEREGEHEEENREQRAAYELLRSQDPQTGQIPVNIRAKELAFARRLNADLKAGSQLPQSVAWSQRGPYGIGGRTIGLAIDVTNENILLAGGTSGGVWRSENKGNSWTRMTPVNELPSVTCIEQDIRPGKTNIWYYGTGELGGNTAGYPLWLNSSSFGWGIYYGNGMYKSVDSGKTWNVLPSTVVDTVGAIVQPFNFVHTIAVDPSATQDVVYAAVPGGIERSTDGGLTWTMTLGEFGMQGSAFTDVAVSTAGVVYAILGGYSLGRGTADTTGLFRSTDGIHWTNITPASWIEPGYYVSIALAPSNENVLYATYDSDQGENILWKYTYISGDGTGTGGQIEDRSQNLTQSGVNFSIYVAVKLDDENVVFVGGLYLVRSTDGFATPDNTARFENVHVDHSTTLFFPSKPSSMIIGNDGGIFMTNNGLAPTISWKNLNNNYFTTQFYTVTVNHSIPGDETIVGGMQDNSTYMTLLADPDEPWAFLLGGDGATCAIGSAEHAYYVSLQNAYSYRYLIDEFGSVYDWGRLDPSGGKNYVWINPFVLDPNNTNRMYMGGGTIMWRNDDLTTIPSQSDETPAVGWKSMTTSRVSTGSNPRMCAIAVSTYPSDIVYYGTIDGQIFRLDDAANAATRKTISTNKGFPIGGVVSSLAVDSKDANHAMVAFANYNIQSLFETVDGGTSWVPVGGNLEEYPNGKGSGPACRSVLMIHSGSGMVYLVGTTTGLYSTTKLDGMNTVWTLEGASSIGNNIVNYLDARELDGRVAVATCGAGIFTGNFEPPSYVHPDPKAEVNIFLNQNFPNPFDKKTEIAFSLLYDGEATLTIFDILGNDIATLVSGNLSAGEHTISWDATNTVPGLYYYRLTSGTHSVVKQLIVKR